MSGQLFTPNGIQIFPGSGGADVALADFNGDGKLDLAAVFVIDGAGTGRLGVYLGDGHGNFTAAPGSPFALGNNPWSVVTGDFNRDGKLDIAVCNDGAANQQPDTFDVFLGDGHGGFVAAPGSPIRLPSNTGPLSLKVADFNGDGKLDLFKTNFSDDTATLYRNNGDGTFDDVTFAAGLGLHTQYLGWGTMFLDFDNDGWPDLLLVNGHVYPEVDKQHLGSNYQEPRILYHNNGDGKFTDVSELAGPAITTANSSRGLAVGDLWNDGRTSAVINNMSAAPSLLENQMRYLNHWIAIKAVGTKSNRDGIGARITIKAGKRIFVDDVRSGSSYISNSDMRVHFGLGAATKIDSLEIRWPNGQTEKFPAPAVDKIHAIKEGSGTSATPENKK